MKLFKCVITGDELFSDNSTVEIAGGFYRVVGKITSKLNWSENSLIGYQARGASRGRGETSKPVARLESGLFYTNRTIRSKMF